jgi:hypothetical protein
MSSQPPRVGKDDLQVLEIRQRRKDSTHSSVDFMVQKDRELALKLQREEDLGDQNKRSYEIEKILRSRLRNGQLEFLIKWQGYPQSQNSWAVRSDFDDPAFVDSFLEHERIKKLDPKFMTKKRKSDPSVTISDTPTLTPTVSQKKSRQSSPIIIE